MDDDFNTPVALAVLQRLRSDVNKLLSEGLSTEGAKDGQRGVSVAWQCPGFVSIREVAIQTGKTLTIEQVPERLDRLR